MKPGMTSQQWLDVAVVGAGPAGLYAAEALLNQKDVAVRIHLIERLPVPFGLLRYGVAPDHQNIRAVRQNLAPLLVQPDLKFYGNIALGRDISVAELRASVDAVIYAYGAAGDRRLDIPGEALKGCAAATDFVAWYCGNPDACLGNFESALKVTKSVVVIGVGNVAIDVSRILAKSRAGLSHTEMPEHVLEALGNSAVTDIHVIGRRGPAQASFTTKELRELGELADADVFVDANDLQLDPVSAAAVAGNRALARNIDVLREWSQRKPTGKLKRIHLHFFLRPVALSGAESVTAIRFERTRIDDTGNCRGTGEHHQIEAQLVLRSIGFRGKHIEGLPFDVELNRIPNLEGRVLRDGRVACGEYVSGWIRRGPIGVLGTNKLDASESVAALLADAPALLAAKDGARTELDDLVRSRALRRCELPNWHAIDAAEKLLGQSRGRDRTIIHRLESLLEAGGA
jgi:ferredoxin--NADP+ reductase